LAGCAAIKPKGGRHTLGETKTRYGRRLVNLTPRTFPFRHAVLGVDPTRLELVTSAMRGRSEAFTVVHCRSKNRLNKPNLQTVPSCTFAVVRLRCRQSVGSSAGSGSTMRRCAPRPSALAMPRSLAAASAFANRPSCPPWPTRLPRCEPPLPGWAWEDVSLCGDGLGGTQRQRRQPSRRRQNPDKGVHAGGGGGGKVGNQGEDSVGGLGRECPAFSC
jgi:hypothetical protein